jgi:hypothetical protein
MKSPFFFLSKSATPPEGLPRAKSTTMVKSTSTGWPFFIAGVYLHCLTASIAASAKPQPPAEMLTGRMVPTVPSLRIRTARVTCPLLLFAIASGGYRGVTLDEIMIVGIEPPSAGVANHSQSLE